MHFFFKAEKVSFFLKRESAKQPSQVALHATYLPPLTKYGYIIIFILFHTHKICILKKRIIFVKRNSTFRVPFSSLFLVPLHNFSFHIYSLSLHLYLYIFSEPILHSRSNKKKNFWETQLFYQIRFCFCCWIRYFLFF